jgi:hypothetical protein
MVRVGIITAELPNPRDVLDHSPSMVEFGERNMVFLVRQEFTILPQPTMYEGTTEFRANLSLSTDIHGPFQTILKHVFLSFLFLTFLQLRNASNEPRSQ